MHSLRWSKRLQLILVLVICLGPFSSVAQGSGSNNTILLNGALSKTPSLPESVRSESVDRDEEQALSPLNFSTQQATGSQPCTTWSLAQLADPNNPSSAGDAVSSFELRNVAAVEKIMPPAELNFRTEADETGRIPDSTTIITSTIWNVLVRPNQPFAVFYSSDAPFTNERVFDVNTTSGAHIPPFADPTHPFHDEDHDAVPDYVERIYSCLVQANERYSNYYGTDRKDLAYVPMHYLPMNITTDSSGMITSRITHTKQIGTFYPVAIRDQGNKGNVEPLSIPYYFGNTFMKLDSGHNGATNDTLTTRTVPPTVSLTQYPKLESIIYHELAHSYQGLFKTQLNLFDLEDQWSYEGYAVYVQEQALLAPCGTSIPPRIPGKTSSCNHPTLYERNSEGRLAAEGFFGAGSGERLLALQDLPWVPDAVFRIRKAKRGLWVFGANFVSTCFCPWLCNALK